MDRQAPKFGPALSAAAIALCLAVLPLSSEQASAEEVLRVGLLIPGPISDQGWMESAYDGMKAAEAEFGDKIKVQMVESVKDADLITALTTLATHNQVVIGAGGQTVSSIEKVAPRFPKVKFVQVAGALDKEYPNVALYDVRQAEAGFLAGALAAMQTKTGVLQFIAGVQYPPVANAGIEFQNGAKYIKPNIKVITTFTGDFDDVEKAKEGALAGIAEGADVEYSILNLGRGGLEQAVREKGAHIVGSYADRCGTDPLYLGYTITGVGYLVQYGIEQAMAGTWLPIYKPFGLSAGPKASGIAVCKGVATPDQIKKIDEIKKDLLDGKIQVLKS